MGIRVWYQRGGAASDQGGAPAAAPDPQPAAAPVQPARQAEQVAARGGTLPSRKTPAETPVETEATTAAPDDPVAAPHAPIRFAWLACGSGLLAGVGQAGQDERFAGDVARFLHWRQTGGYEGRLRSGDFTWPQIDNAASSPERALAAFFRKHLTAADTEADPFWLALTPEAQELRPWLPDNVRLLDLPDLALCASDATEKRLLWHRLSESA